MSINDHLRSQSLAIRDRLSGLIEQKTRAISIRDAAEESVKQAKTEITKQKNLTLDRNKDVAHVSDKVLEVQHLLEELDQKRQIALESLIQLQNEQHEKELARREAQDATDKALAFVRKEETARQESEQTLSHILSSQNELEIKLRSSLLKGLEIYLEQQTSTIHSAFATQEERAQALKSVEAFKSARHTDFEIARLCDERDEIKRIITGVQVPGVKELLQESLSKKEKTIQEKFPNALSALEAPSIDNPIEELLFYCNTAGKVVLLLPISLDDWTNLANPLSTETQFESVCLLWNMIRELGLRKEDGCFEIINGRVVFSSQFDLETVASQSFTVKSNSVEVVRFVLSSAPSELQEALCNEDKNG
jgi:chromosome segregation ATPase